MINRKLIFFVVASISFFCHNAAGQVSKKPRTSKSDSVSAPVKSFNHTEKIETTYDRFENTSMIFLSVTLKDLVGLDTTTLSVSYHYEGKTPPRKVGEISLSITRFFGDFGDYNRFRNPSTLTFLLDGRRLVIPMKATRELGYRKSGRDTADAWISHSNFLLITKALSVEGRLADIEFTLTDSHLEALRDFADRLRQQN